jgi:cytochrome c heme-lyase
MGTSASTPVSPPAPSATSSPCPVDHKTRELWLQQHQEQNSKTSHLPEPNLDASQTPKNISAKSHRPLSNNREVSSIPRAFDADSQQTSAAGATGTAMKWFLASSSSTSHATPSNAESETGHDSTTGNWIYPSERQFFEALVRKNNVPASTGSATDLATSVASIIPIHNAVNERAWFEILQWESSGPTSDPGSKKCGGPRLYAFRGLGIEPQFLSPRARMNGWLGYQRPFDRHDWVVERCDGQRIEYVIDFYQGKSDQSSRKSGLAGNIGRGKLSFYLDVRPKLNSLEGWRLRFNRFFGL